MSASGIHPTRPAVQRDWEFLVGLDPIPAGRGNLDGAATTVRTVLIW